MALAHVAFAKVTPAKEEVKYPVAAPVVASEAIAAANGLYSLVSLLLTPFSWVYNALAAVRATMVTPPKMGNLGLTLRGTLTGYNLVGYLLSFLVLDIPLVSLIDLLYTVTCSGPSASYGILGNVVYTLTIRINPISVLLGGLGVGNIIQVVLDYLFYADC